MYLLNIRELLDGERGERLRTWSEEWLDDTRRKKAERCLAGRPRAAGIGAGLLIQLGVQELESGVGSVCRKAENSADKASEVILRRPEAAQEAQVLWQELSVTELLGRLNRRLRLSYDYGERGKPFLRGYPWYFSLSHSGDYVLCALSRRDVGADLQKVESVDTEKLAGRFFAGQECEALRACGTESERRNLFFALWTKKEAFGKLTGQGVAGVLGRNMLDFSPFSGEEPFQSRKEGTDGSRPRPGAEKAEQSACGAEAPEWLEISVPEGYAAAVCLKGREISFTGVEQWDD